MRPLQSGTAYLAQRTGYPILTVGITGSHDLWWRKRLTAGHRRWAMPTRRITDFHSYRLLS